MIKVACQKTIISRESYEKFLLLVDRNEMPYSISEVDGGYDVVVFECAITDSAANVLNLTLLDMVYNMV